jgi:hypothetical protein
VQTKLFIGSGFVDGPAGEPSGPADCVIAIEMTVGLRRGIWGLLASRSRVSVFPIGYRVDVTAPVSIGPPRRVGHE